MVARHQEVWQGGDSPNALPGWGHPHLPSMSPGDIRALLHQSKSTDSTRLLYALFLIHADRLGYAMVRNAQIAEAAGLSLAQTRFQLYRLRDMGEIECLRRGTRQRPTLWHVVGVAEEAA